MREIETGFKEKLFLYEDSQPLEQASKTFVHSPSLKVFKTQPYQT